MARHRAADPLLEALSDPARAPFRPEPVETLASLMIRVEDARISNALTDHLASDSQPKFRSPHSSAHGMHLRAEAIPACWPPATETQGDLRPRPGTVWGFAMVRGARQGVQPVGAHLSGRPQSGRLRRPAVQLKTDSAPSDPMSRRYSERTFFERERKTCFF